MQSRAWIAWMAWLLAAGIVRVLPAGETFGPAERFTVTHLTTRDGLAQDSVHGLAMDRAGYLWIGTLQGISRYDGQGFVTHTPRTTPGMPSNGIAAMATTDDGTLWIGTTKGLARLIPDGSRVEIEPSVQGYCERMLSLGDEVVAGGDWGLVHGKAGSVTHVPVPLRVNSLATTAGSNLWIATPQGLWRMRLPWPATPPRPTLVLSGAFGASMATRGHELWVREGKDLCHLDARTGAMVRRWADVDAEPVLADSHGNLWLAALNPESHRYTELSVLDAGTGRLVPCPIGTGIPTAITSACMEDPSGTLWLGTFTGGLARLRPKLVGVFDTRHGLPADRVQSV